MKFNPLKKFVDEYQVTVGQVRKNTVVSVYLKLSDGSLERKTFKFCTFKEVEPEPNYSSEEEEKEEPIKHSPNPKKGVEKDCENAKKRRRVEEEDDADVMESEDDFTMSDKAIPLEETLNEEEVEPYTEYFNKSEVLPMQLLDEATNSSEGTSCTENDDMVDEFFTENYIEELCNTSRESEANSNLEMQDNKLIVKSDLLKGTFLVIPFAVLTEKTESSCCNKYYELEDHRIVKCEYYFARHSCEPNATVHVNQSDVIGYTLEKDLKKGDEIFVSYNWNYKIQKNSFKNSVSVCSCNASKCRLFIENDLASSLEYALLKMQPIKNSPSILDDSIFKDISNSANDQQILQKLKSYSQHSKAENSTICVLVALIRRSFTYSQIYREIKDPTLSDEKFASDPKLQGKAKTWVSKKAAVGKAILIWNEAITNQNQQVLQFFTGSLKKIEQVSRKLLDLLESESHEKAKIYTLLKQIYDRVQKEKML